LRLLQSKTITDIKQVAENRPVFKLTRGTVALIEISFRWHLLKTAMSPGRTILLIDWRAAERFATHVTEGSEHGTLSGEKSRSS
jgi:hypothetical protein